MSVKVVKSDERLLLREQVFSWMSQDRGLVSSLVPASKASQWSDDEGKEWVKALVSASLNGDKEAEHRVLTREAACQLRRQADELVALDPCKSKDVSSGMLAHMLAQVNHLWDCLQVGLRTESSGEGENGDKDGNAVLMAFVAAHVELVTTFTLLAAESALDMSTDLCVTSMLAFMEDLLSTEHFRARKGPTGRVDASFDGRPAELLHALGRRAGELRIMFGCERTTPESDPVMQRQRLTEIRAIYTPKNAALKVCEFVDVADLDQCWVVHMFCIEKDILAGRWVRSMPTGPLGGEAPNTGKLETQGEQEERHDLVVNEGGVVDGENLEINVDVPAQKPVPEKRAGKVDLVHSPVPFAGRENVVAPPRGDQRQTGALKPGIDVVPLSPTNEKKVKVNPDVVTGALKPSVEIVPLSPADEKEATVDSDIAKDVPNANIAQENSRPSATRSAAGDAVDESGGENAIGNALDEESGFGKRTSAVINPTPNVLDVDEALHLKPTSAQKRPPTRGHFVATAPPSNVDARESEKSDQDLSIIDDGRPSPPKRPIETQDVLNMFGGFRRNRETSRVERGSGRKSRRRASSNSGGERHGSAGSNQSKYGAHHARMKRTRVVTLPSGVVELSSEDSRERSAETPGGQSCGDGSDTQAAGRSSGKSRKRRRVDGSEGRSQHHSNEAQVKNKYAFTPKEDEILMSLIQKVGYGKWSKILTRGIQRGMWFSRSEAQLRKRAYEIASAMEAAEKGSR